VSGKMSTACCSGGAGSNGPAVAPRTPYHKDRSALGQDVHSLAAYIGVAVTRECRCPRVA
jgi:hypothetical protein